MLSEIPTQITRFFFCQIQGIVLFLLSIVYPLHWCVVCVGRTWDTIFPVRTHQVGCKHYIATVSVVPAKDNRFSAGHGVRHRGVCIRLFHTVWVPLNMHYVSTLSLRGGRRTAVWWESRELEFPILMWEVMTVAYSLSREWREAKASGWIHSMIFQLRSLRRENVWGSITTERHGQLKCDD